MLARGSKRAILAFLGLSLLVGVILASVSRYFEGVETQRRLQDEKASLKQREDFVFTVEPRTIERERRYAVAVDPWMVSDVPAEVAGRVSATKVEPGSRVKKGEPLVLLDDEIAASDLRRAEAAKQREELLKAVRELDLELGKLADDIKVAKTESVEAARRFTEIAGAPFEEAVPAGCVAAGAGGGVDVDSGSLETFLEGLGTPIISGARAPSWTTQSAPSCWTSAPSKGPASSGTPSMGPSSTP